MGLVLTALISTGIVLDFGCGKSGIQPFFGHTSKSVPGQISSQIWPMPVQLQLPYVQLITNKTNAADLSRSADTNVNLNNLQNSLAYHKFSQKLANSDCLFIAAGSMVDAISFIRHIVL